MLGKSLATPKDHVMIDVQGRKWVNGSTPIDPTTEAPAFDRVVTEAQLSYENYVKVASRASLAKNDFDWKRISNEEFSRQNYEMSNAAYRFDNARRQLNDMSSTIAGKYNRQIPLDDLLVIASCNAIPVGSADMVSYDAVIAKGQHCSPGFKPNTGM